MIINLRIPLSFALLMLLLPACNNNNNNEEPVIKKDDTPVQEKAMQEAIAKYPDSAALRMNLVKYYQDNGTTDLALAEMGKALQKDSNNVQLWDKKAELCIEQNDTACAIAAYNKAIEIFPDPQFIMSVGWLYAQKKDPNALVMADALLIGKNARAEKEALLIKGLYFSAIGNKQKAITFFDECLSLDYTYMFAYREKAIVLYELAKYDDALRLLDKALAVKSNFDEAYYWMGRCFEKLNRTNDAIESYRSAILYNPEYIEAKEALAKLGVK